MFQVFEEEYQTTILIILSHHEEYDRVFMNLLLKENKLTIVTIDGYLMKIATPMWERNSTNLTRAVAPM
jgi:hypothetical protein